MQRSTAASLTDQALYSASNFLFAILAIRELPTADVGVVGIAMSMLGFSLVFVRGLSETFFVDATSSVASRLPFAFAVLSGALGAVGCLGLFAYLRIGSFSPAASELAVHMVPGIVSAAAYEVVRQWRFSKLAIGRLVVSDALWLSVVLGGVLVAGTENVGVYWSIGAVIALAAAHPTASPLRQIGIDWRITLKVGGAVGIDQAAHRLAMATCLAVLAAVGSDTVAAGVTSARTLLGPANWVILSVSSVGMVQFRRVQGRSSRMRRLTGFMALSVAVPLSIGAVAIGYPDPLQHVVGSATAAHMLAAMAWIAVGVAAEGIGASAAVVVRHRMQVGRYLRPRLVAAIVIAGGPALLSALQGPTAGYAALVVGQLLHAGVMVRAAVWGTSAGSGGGRSAS